MGISSLDRKEAEIAELVRHAPLQHSLTSNDSFRTFYENLRAMSQQRSCQIENLLEKIGP
jgi:predicted DNA-binding ribbon-helix-helix protein